MIAASAPGTLGPTIGERAGTVRATSIVIVDPHPGTALPQPTAGRLRSLDGLRGAAALVVVVHHCFLTDEVFAAPYLGLPGARFPSLAWWLTYTPLHLIWAGPEAVLVFFVLSGFVLTRATNERGFRWRSYYPSRFLRLYPPAWAALGLAAAIEWAFLPSTPENASWWMNDHIGRVSGAAIGRDALLVRAGGGSSWLLTSLWSLKWEVIFSLALPAMLIAASRYRAVAAAELVALLMLTGIGLQAGSPAVTYLPLFGIGVLMARHQAAISAFTARFSRRTWRLVATASLVLVTCPWSAHAPTNPSLAPAEAAGAALLVVVFAFWRPVVAYAERPSLQWLGKRSFSLYLVHEPIVVATAFMLGPGTTSLLLTLAIALPLALVVAHLFFSVVESPNHRLARAVAHRGRALEVRVPAMSESR
jgi:peptidoglycan/LPS O-acetylase OafA/YrhL